MTGLNSPLKQSWERAYTDGATPFDREEPDEWIAALEADGCIRGVVLDAGCGPGRTSLFLASLGYQVVGMDISEVALARARETARLSEINVHFEQADLAYGVRHSATFDTIVDIGCFHSLHGAASRESYARNLCRMSKSGTRLFLRAFSARNTKPKDWRGYWPNASRDEIQNCFYSAGWFIEHLAERKTEINTRSGSTQSVYCWFCEMIRSQNTRPVS